MWAWLSANPQTPTVTKPIAAPVRASPAALRPRRRASQASNGSTSAVVSFTPSPKPSAAPAAPHSTAPAPSRRHAAAAGSDAATRSFCAVVASSATSVNVAKRNALNAAARTGKPSRRAEP